jgi:photosystem II stability/assembly factor-like uncharacterized protein
MTRPTASPSPRRAARLLTYSLISALQLWCADPIRNTGEPMTVPFHCTQDDIAQAGLTCSEEAPCQVYLELTSVANEGSKIFVTGNLHTESATLYALLLESDDGGESWTEPVARIRGAGLDLIQFPDFEHGWVSGEMLQPFTRDPFFLITSDGAKTWRQRSIFEEGKPGSIQSFWFGNANDGSLVLDTGSGSSRYQLYDSPTGGDTWTIRESSDKPIRIRSMPPAGTSGWRLRADGKSHSFQVEKRTGETWKSVASFTIAAGYCKPE